HITLHHLLHRALARRETALGFFFFFSSRRRHTRSKRDWSSDVCSSDLPCTCSRSGGGVGPMPAIGTPVRRREDYRFLTGQGTYKIGRASCRERVEISVVGVALKKKNK